ncbi:hypothetical protein M758_6G152100 [Ceratodon purpureus]|nr:hypothetical protein M758_6G152100 [Ceratodon purpureus]KAG0614117.1 hypothetical protein M758_6G152100 [Ceratodon purpureus]
MAAREAMAGAVLAMAVALLAMAANAEVDCSTQLNAMQPCIEYVNSNTSAPPSKPCCTAFNTTQVTMPVCLCQLQQAFSDPATAPGNVTRANEIPSLCAVAVDPSRCPALLGLAPAVAPAVAPVVAPVASPRISPIATPTVAPVGPSPAGADVDCSAEFASLSDCITYVSSNTSTTPPATCCSALLSVHTNKPVCLCQLLQLANDPAQTPAGLNVTKALELPTSCKVNGADVDNCPALLGQPVASPVESPLTAPVPESSPTPEAGAPGVDAGTPAPEATPAVSEPTGNNAATTAASMLLGFTALTLHFFY